MAKKQKSQPSAASVGRAIPAPAEPLVIDGPTARELAAHGSDFLT